MAFLIKVTEIFLNLSGEFGDGAAVRQWPLPCKSYSVHHSQIFPTIGAV
jgi:hypothetical protein